VPDHRAANGIPNAGNERRKEFTMSRFSLLFAVIALMLLSPIPLWCGDEPVAGVPTMKEVQPAVAMPGAMVVVSGEHLDKDHVAEVYLTRGGNDTKVQVTSQSKNELRFKVPVDAESGRYGIALLFNAKTPMLLDQPVYLNVKREIETSTR
jgi:hypothetical protein